MQINEKMTIRKVVNGYLITSYDTKNRYEQYVFTTEEPLADYIATKLTTAKILG